MASTTTSSTANKRTASTSTAKGGAKKARAASDGTKPAAKSRRSQTGSEKALKGLRHFSMKVCKKVEEKGQTSYNEVADELVQEFLTQNNQESKDAATAYDEKNIRRRVYDALNVLMAMDIISKEKKEIKWKGLPNNANHDLEMLQKEKERCLNSIKQKRQGLQELLIQQVCFRNLVERNKNKSIEQNMTNFTPEEINGNQRGDGDQINLPFIVVNTNSNAVIQCEMNADRTDVMFDFSMPFEINDDVEILKKLGMGKIDKHDLGQFIPSDLLEYCENQNLLDTVLHHDSTSSASKNKLSSVAAAAAAAASIPQSQQPFSSTSSSSQQLFTSPPIVSNATTPFIKKECS